MVRVRQRPVFVRRFPWTKDCYGVVPTRRDEAGLLVSPVCGELRLGKPNGVECPERAERVEGHLIRRPLWSSLRSWQVSPDLAKGRRRRRHGARRHIARPASFFRLRASNAGLFPSRSIQFIGLGWTSRLSGLPPPLGREAPAGASFVMAWRRLGGLRETPLDRDERLPVKDRPWSTTHAPSVPRR